VTTTDRSLDLDAPDPAVAAAHERLRAQLADLLPAWMRTTDVDGLLDALVDVLAAAGAIVVDDLDGLGEDWFIETCAEWLVPYIGDLVGVHVLHPLDGTEGISNRARVADTIRLRRRKGTAAALEDLARATTGWPARVVEYFEVLATTQHLDHVRPAALGTVTVRDADAMELVGTPFERACRTADVRALGRSVERGIGSGHNLPNVGIHVWPLASYPVDRVSAAPAAEPADGRWHVDPVGVARHLAGPTVADPGIEARTTEANTPGLLRRRPLHDELDRQRTEPIDEADLTWFQPDDPAFVVWIQETDADPLEPVPLELVHVCDLSDWGRPTGSAVRLDPVLGRASVAAGRDVHRLAVSWSFARAGRIGSGPWDRTAEPLDHADLLVGVRTDSQPGDGLVATLGDAVAAWNDRLAQPDRGEVLGRIVVADSHRYVESFVAGGRLVVPAGCRLELVAADWAAPADGPRVEAGIDRSSVVPTIVGDLEVVGTGTDEPAGTLLIEGFTLVGSVTVASPAADDLGLGRVEIRSCTNRVAGSGLVRVEAGNDRASIVVDRSLLGPIVLAGTPTLDVTDSVLHGPTGGSAIDAPGSDVVTASVTAIGTTDVARLNADDTIFDGDVTVARRQDGCVRYSSVPPGSVTPHRYRCQPDLGPAPPEHLVPRYQSLDPTAPGYAQLAPGAAVELRTGAAGGAEMGAFRSSLTPQRLANLVSSFEEFLPFGRVAAALPVLPRQGAQP